jgi:hypothetical protein
MGMQRLQWRVKTWLRRRQGRTLPRNTLVTWKREQSARLFFVFQGFAMKIQMDPLAFLRETGLLDDNIVMLGDDQRLYYHGGINEEMPDVAGICSRLAAIREDLPHVQQVNCLGSSAGAYAAILFGHYLKVDTVYAFAPQTLIDPVQLQAATGRTDTWRIPEHHRDLAKVLADYNGTTSYKVFYSERSAQDRSFAERIAECGGVQLEPQPGRSHAVVVEMHKRGLLRGVIES